MRFDTIPFVLFFLLICFLYYNVKSRGKTILLVLASYIFYMSYDIKASLLLFFVTIVNYLFGIALLKKKSKLILTVSLILNLLILFVFKYLNFFSDIIGVTTSFNLSSYIVPIGLSFYILENIGYTIDVYRNKDKFQRNFWNYALFISFFPKIVCGPIEDSKKFMNQININRKFSCRKFKDGFWLITFGIFMKLFLSERLAIIVNSVYNNPILFENGGGIYYIIASILYAFQIYYDFKGYSYLARGMGKMLGYNLTINFAKPYLAISIRDFWRRWHISLTSFFRRYLYIPLGGNKKGEIRKILNTLIVFLVSGLWHGASWNYIMWGLLHGMYMVFEDLFSKVKLLKIRNGLISGIFTFLLVDFAWIFFRANSMNDAILIISNLFDFGMELTLANLATNRLDIVLLLAGLIITFLIEMFSKKTAGVKFLLRRNSLLKATACYIILFTTIIFGVYGVGYNAQEFIYLCF